MRRRGMTVLELMIVLVLVTAITAIAVPTLYRRVGKINFEEACTEIEWASVRARERAMREGRAIKLVARADEIGDPVSVYTEPATVEDLLPTDSESGGGDFGADPMLRDLSDFSFDDEFEPEEPGAVDRTQERLMVLPLGTRFALRWAFDQEVDGGAGGGAGEGAFEDFEPSGAFDVPEGSDGFASEPGVSREAVAQAASTLSDAPPLTDRIIAIYLPDGRILPSPDEPVLVADKKVARISIDTWLNTLRAEPGYGNLTSGASGTDEGSGEDEPDIDVPTSGSQTTPSTGRAAEPSEGGES